MRRNRRGIYDDTENYKAILWVAGVILVIAIIAFFVVYGIYNNKIEAAELGIMNKETSKIDISNSTTNSTIVSSSIGKNVNEVKNSALENTVSNEILNTVINSTSNSNTIVTSTTKVQNETSSSIAIDSNSTSNETTVSQNKVQDEVIKEEKEPSFQNPIESGEIMREFAKENLVYSDTLEEWITHLGVDIKAPKTTVVKAAEAGTVESIKNDPRYGLTIIVKHAKEYKTVYSNLLTTEFVSVGDEVTLGQSLGTVGNSAAFEIADEPHLHFEIIKNNEKVNPTLYINF